MSDSSDVRVSDAERERVAALLRDHAAEGRLDAAELEERLGRAFGARTRGELAALTADLPRAPGRRERRGLSEHARTYLAVMALLVTIWALTGMGYFWPVWPMLGWGLAFVLPGCGHGHHARRARASVPRA